MLPHRLPTSRAAMPTPEVRATKRELVLQYFVRQGNAGATDCEGQRATGLGPQSYGPRRIELRKDGLVMDSLRRRRTEHNKEAIVWVLTEAHTN